MTAVSRDERRSETHAPASLSVCIITTAIISDNPRVIKEADALTNAGHRVRVVAFEPRSADALARDEATMYDKHWRLATISTVADSAPSAIGLALRTLTERIAKWMVRRDRKSVV